MPDDTGHTLYTRSQRNLTDQRLEELRRSFGADTPTRRPGARRHALARRLHGLADRIDL